MNKNIFSLSITTLLLYGCATGQILPASSDVRLINTSQAEYCQVLGPITAEVTVPWNRAQKEWHDEALRLLLDDARKQTQAKGGNALSIRGEATSQSSNLLLNLVAFIVAPGQSSGLKDLSLETVGFVCPNPLEPVTTSVSASASQIIAGRLDEIPISEIDKTRHCKFLSHLEYGDTVQRPLSFVVSDDPEKERPGALANLREKARTLGADTLVIYLNGQVRSNYPRINLPVIIAEAFRCGAQ